MSIQNIILRQIVLLLLLFVPITSANAQLMKAGVICTNYVNYLIADDYQALVKADYLSSEIYDACEAAHKAVPKHPAFSFGLARAYEIYPFGYTASRSNFDKAVALLRSAAAQNYEPAMFQLFRYLWEERPIDDPFLQMRYRMIYRISDDRETYIERLKDSKSLIVRDYVLGFLVNRFERPKLVRKLAFKNVELGSVKAKYYLGMMYASGLGVERNAKKGIMLIKEAAELGDMTAQYKFSIIIGPDSKKILDAKISADDIAASMKFTIDLANRNYNPAFTLLNRYVDDVQLDAELKNIISCGLDEKLTINIINFKPLPKCKN